MSGEHENLVPNNPDNNTLGQDEMNPIMQLQESGDCIIKECKKDLNVSNYEKLLLSPEQKMHISELVQHLPNMVAAGSMANAYTISFPKGLPHTLMKLSQAKGGGYTTSIMKNGKIAGQASLFQMTGQAAVLGAFTAMSIVTGQYFLAQINRELRTISKKMDEILSFL